MNLSIVLPQNLRPPRGQNLGGGDGRDTGHGALPHAAGARAIAAHAARSAPAQPAALARLQAAPLPHSSPSELTGVQLPAESSPEVAAHGLLTRWPRLLDGNSVDLKKCAGKASKSRQEMFESN